MLLNVLGKNLTNHSTSHPFTKLLFLHSHPRLCPVRGDGRVQQLPVESPVGGCCQSPLRRRPPDVPKRASFSLETVVDSRSPSRAQRGRIGQMERDRLFSRSNSCGHHGNDADEEGPGQVVVR